MRPLLQRLLLVTFMFVAACSADDWVDKIASPAEQAAARSYIDQLRQKRYDDIERDLDPALRKGDIRPTLAAMSALIPEGKSTSEKIVGANKFSSPGGTALNITFEYEFAGRWVLANVATREAGGTRTITGFNVYPIPASLEAQNRFTFEGKGASHYLAVALATAATAVSLWALVRCIRTRGLRRKWAWLLFIVVGFGWFGLNWTTGQWAINPFYLQLLSAGASAAFYGPWFVSFSVPLGAIVFLARRRPPVSMEADAAPPLPGT